MKFVVYSILIFVGGLLFLPTNDQPALRNVPLLLCVLSLIAVFYLVKFIKYIVLMWRTKDYFERNKPGAAVNMKKH